MRIIRLSFLLFHDINQINIYLHNVDVNVRNMMGNTQTDIPLYRKKIDAHGNYLPFAGYTIVSHARHPLPTPLIELVNYLSSSELAEYYSFLPATSFHVTINPLENVRDEHRSLLHDEQRKLKEQDTSFVCTAKNFIRSKVILIEVEFPNENVPNILQNVRSDRLQQAAILPKYALTWHLTLAYRYKNIETDEIDRKLNHIMENIPQSSTFPFDISLDQIRICHYDDLTRFTPI